MSVLKNKKIKSLVSKYSTYVTFFSLVLVIGILSPQFFSLRVLRDLAVQSSVKLILALGMVFVSLAGNSDLSSGRIVGLAAVVAGSLSQSATYVKRFYPDMPELPLIVPILVCIVLGALAGLINGLIVTKLRVDGFIGTLGVQLAIYGITSIYYNLEPNRSQPLGGFKKSFAELGTGDLMGIPYITMIAVTLMIICHIVLKYHRFGKTVYAVGGNQQAAIVSGINAHRVIVICYVIAGLLAGLAGCLEAARTGGATNGYGNGYEFDAICACVVGGVSLNGGVGTVSGTFIGVLIFQLIQYGMTFLGINPYWQNVVKGAIVVISVAIDMRRNSKE